MYVVFILYICHLVSPYQVRKTLSCCMKEFWGQRSGWGTLTSYILPTLRSKIFFIFIVINSFNTTLPTFFYWIHLGRNTCEVSIVLNPPLERWNSIPRALVEPVLMTLFTTCGIQISLTSQLVMCCGLCGTTGWYT